MSEIRTLDHLQNALDKEMAWRIKEIGVFQVGSKTNGPARKTYIRAGIALVYAHWEGFIKSASTSYLEYVQYRGHKYSELKSCFAIFGLKGKLELLTVSGKSVPNIEAFEFILSALEQPAKLNGRAAIDTQSNLTSKVFSNIASSLDIAIGDYETKFNLIDESLVSRRNKVAHGEFLDLDGEQFADLVVEVVGLMRSYKNDLENAASLESYKR
jgi:hypothetical protein